MKISCLLQRTKTRLGLHLLIQVAENDKFLKDIIALFIIAKQQYKPI